jgi:hypothetical protein
MLEFDWLQYLKRRGKDRLRCELGDFGIHAFFAIAAVGEVDISGTHDFWKVDFLALRSDGLCVRYHPSKTHDDKDPRMGYFAGGAPLQLTSSGDLHPAAIHAPPIFTNWVDILMPRT